MPIIHCNGVNGPLQQHQDAHIPSNGCHVRKHSSDSEVIPPCFEGCEEFDDDGDGDGYSAVTVTANGNDIDNDTCHSPGYFTKRRRSNDWPLPPAVEEGLKLPHSNQIHTHTHNTNAETRYRSPRKTKHYRLFPTPCAGASRHEKKGDKDEDDGDNGNMPASPTQVRRSRFVEASMSDSISEKPPSVFIRDLGRGDGRSSSSSSSAISTTNHNITSSGQQQRQSGIFRFGRTLVSAFNPFGGLRGNVSEIWKGLPDTNNNSSNNKAQKDLLMSQAEKAYAELKKSGYKGTVKGSYIQQSQSQSGHTNMNMDIPDQTWKVIQEKMDYNNNNSNKASGRHERQNPAVLSRLQQQTESRLMDRKEATVTVTAIPIPVPTFSHLELGTSLRSSFQDLRRAKSSIIPSIKRQDTPATDIKQPSTATEDLENAATQVRKQKSRKDLLRQAKLLKQVSNLEDKLEKAKRELRELAHDDDDGIPRSCTRKFVPGCLPSLSTERFFERHHQLSSGESDAGNTNNEKAQPATTAVATTAAAVAAPPRIIWSPEGVPSQPPRTKKNALRPSSGNLIQDPLVNNINNNNKPYIHQHGATGNKRKSPDPESRVTTSQKSPNRQTEPDNNTPATPNNNRRKATKLPKNRKEDSPGYVERKQQQQQQQSQLYSSSLSPSHSSHRRSPNSKKGSNSRPTPSLRTRKSISDLRSAIAMDKSSSSSPSCQVGSYYRESDSDSNSELNYYFTMEGEDVPPVPPVPKGLVLGKSPVNNPKQVAREKTDMRMHTKSNNSKSIPTFMEKEKDCHQEFRWPDEIF